MPQMSPLSWLTLMITFMLTMILINSIMYFSKNYNSKSMKKKLNVNKILWKW